MNWDSRIRERETAFAKALKVAGHELMLIDDEERGPVGQVDFFAHSTDEGGGHNGPVCQKCRRSWCVWCWDGKPLFKCEAAKEAA